MQVAARVAVAGVAVASAPLTLPHRTTSRSLAQANTGQQQVAAQVGGSASAEESAWRGGHLLITPRQDQEQEEETSAVSAVGVWGVGV